MGASASKPQLEFKTETPVQFNDELLNQIQNSAENDFIREQKADRYIQEEVSKALANLEQETLATFEDKLNTSLLSNTSEETQELSSKQLTQDVSKLNTHLNKLIDQQVNKIGDATKKDDLKNIKAALAKCLTDNKGKPLNCYEEVQKFKEFTDAI